MVQNRRVRKTKLMRQVEEQYHNEPLETLLPRLYNEMGLPGMVREIGIGKATLWYWMLIFGVELRKIAVVPGEDVYTQKSAR